ncbi:hypothetical protein CEW88_11615 [Alloyangia pacifica]|uniref:Uncharacterized protein n=1 Tax=Alloyangia pacifica TaxID=311180 RepID=A0A2U8HHP7_9RHOB|nr:hypothetical protein [Alloyangia pacifica]AWI84275.1 hypothetical protein CEW88_11615 [Alloyangia pacifica]
MGMSGFVTNPDGSVTFPSGKTLTRKQIEEQNERRANDRTPVTRAELTRSEKALLEAIGEVLKAERRFTDECLAPLRDAIKDLSGREVLTGAARLISDGNAKALSSAIEPALHRRAVILDGTPPDWLQGMFQ